MDHTTPGLAICALLLMSWTLPSVGRPSDAPSTPVSYLPYYGGAKGQYLKVPAGEEPPASDAVLTGSSVPATEVARELNSVLREVRSEADALLRMRPSAGSRDEERAEDREAVRARYRSRLASVRAAATRLVRVVDRLGDQVDALIAAAGTATKHDYQIEDVGEEGVSIDSPSQDEGLPGGVDLGAVTIAEAKPFGLAVVGENGVASSRPHATALAAHGAALARPTATAIAGLNPADLGLHFPYRPDQKH